MQTIEHKFNTKMIGLIIAGISTAVIATIFFARLIFGKHQASTYSDEEIDA